jgi:succinate-semialdehyde dehydrogenase
LIALSRALRDDAQNLAHMIALEMGKPTTQVEGAKARIEFRPLCPILAVMP